MTLSFALELTADPSFADPPNETVARIHWHGLNQISADTNSAQFMKVWRLPQTAALVAQTLDKISRWPGGSATNAATTLLRPLLDDLITSEFLLEVHASTNQPDSTSNLQIFLEIQLPPERASLWQTNLAAALEARNGVGPVPAADGSGWSFRQKTAPRFIEFSHVGQWTRICVGQGPDALPHKFSNLKAGERPPRTRSSTNIWLEADLELPHLASVFPNFYFPLSTFHHLHLTVSGEGGNLLTRGTVGFSHPLNLELPPWEIPTNLIHQPFTSFLAVRGLGPWLADLPAWQKLRLAPPPNQAYFWSEPVIPFQTYVAAPLPAASNQLYQLAGRLVQNANPWLVTNGQGNFQWETNLPGIVWNDANLITPFVKYTTARGQDYFVGGFYPLNPDSSRPPTDAVRAVLGTTNLVYYHIEPTGARVEDYLYITQLFRLVFHKPQLPGEAAVTRWLKSVEPLLAGSTTIVTQAGAQQLVVSRVSTIGFTALELHLIVDWLESPPAR